MTLSPNSDTDAMLSPTNFSVANTTSTSSLSFSPSICPHCYNNIDFTPQEGSQVHPTNISNSHADFEAFKLAANTALKGQFEGAGYDEAKALLLNWKANDLGLKTPEAGSLIIDETQKLQRVLEDSYRFQTEYFSIPSHNPQPRVQKLLADAIVDLSDKKWIHKKRVLLLVYYNGHGAMKNGKLIWSARSTWRYDSPEYPAISWYDLQGMLEKAEFDVLLVLDCCHAAGAITKGTTGTMEVLAGCGREVKAIAPGMGSVLGSPFTHSLIKHLEESATRPQGLLITELQAFLSLDKVLENQSPNHVVLSGHDNPINLRPICPEGELQQGESLTSPITKAELKALVAISFRGNVLPETEAFVRWLNTQYPKEIHHIKVEKVSLEGSFNSCSTLMLLAMPISLWAHLQGLPSSLLVGFVKSRNYMLDTYQDMIVGLEDKVANIELLKGLPRKGAPVLAEAEAIYLRALESIEKAFGPDHILTLLTVGNLGNLYLDQGKLAEAEQMYIRVLERKEKALGPDHTSTLDTFHNLGNLYLDQGKLVEAEQIYIRVLERKEKALGPDHISTLDTFHNLGNLYSDQGKLAEAEQMYIRALKGKEQTLEPDHISILNTINSLGTLYLDQGKLVEAEKMYLRALEAKEKVFGLDHTSTLDTFHNLVNLYLDQGKLAEAEKIYLRVLERKEKALGPDHTSTLDTFHNLGNLYSDQGKLAEAEKMYLRALEGKEQTLEPDYISILNTINSLGTLYKKQGKLVKAEQIYFRALEIWRRHFD